MVASEALETGGVPALSQNPDEEQRVLERVRSSVSRNDVVDALLTTDERVIARVTDGIYRQPGSAIRELISNAYDADATRVTVLTDAPRFGRMVVEDDGHGMSPEVLTRLLHHIGGSAKRTSDGRKLGITSKDDPYRSPAGRKLIGKIGIGLFSVSQLTQSFQIVTKVKGDKYSTVATVVMKQYTENEPKEKRVDDVYEAGRVKIWREPSSFPDSHGTAITLTGIRPAVRKVLKSASMWDLIDAPTEEGEPASNASPPVYHIGRTDPSENNLRVDHGADSNLPWEADDGPKVAFKKLVDSVWSEVGRGNPNPQLERVLDYYLQMIWQLALALPIPYVDKSIFDEEIGPWASFYQLSNSPRGAARKLQGSTQNATVREAFAIEPTNPNPLPFEVDVDGLRLQRPIRYRDLPVTDHAIREPMVFIGSNQQTFENVSSDFSGGELSFHAYLFWTPKVAPTEHRGSLIRIHGASGTLFDQTFMRYQIAEQTRLKQITCEIFVSKGLEAALNIDRESFNNSHPHVVYLTRWLHNALRQLANAQKAEARRIRASSHVDRTERQKDRLSAIVEEVWALESGDEGFTAPRIFFEPALPTSAAETAGSYYKFDIPPGRAGRATRAQDSGEDRIRALLQVLAAFDVLDNIDSDRRQRLVTAMFKIMNGNDD